MQVDSETISRALSHIQDQINYLMRELRKGDDEYSPLMDFDKFQKMKAEAISAFGGWPCLIGSAEHRCSTCERLVAAYMSKRTAKKAA